MTRKKEGARRGRPPKKPQDRADFQISVRVTAAQEREIRQLAAKQDLSVSEWLRAYAVTAAIALRNPVEAGAIVRDGSRPVERVVDQAELERRGQLRAPGV